MRSRVGRAVVASVLAGAVACTAASAAPPPVVLEFLTALRDGDLAAAYDLTDLDRFPRAPGFALTQEHFEAFYGQNPVLGFEIAQVFSLERTDQVGRSGVDYAVVDVDLTFEHGVRRQQVDVEGTILPRVMVLSESILFAAGQDFPDQILVDGVPTDVSGGDGTVNLAVLPGRHAITIGDRELTLSTEPLEIVAGSARVTDSVPPMIELGS